MGIFVDFVQTHPTMKGTEIFQVPAGAINLRSADGSLLKKLGDRCYKTPVFTKHVIYKKWMQAYNG